MLTFSHRSAFAGCLAALALAAFLASVGPLVASPGPAVGLSASAGAAAVAAGERLAFTVKLVNTGDEKANNLAISAALAPGFVYVPYNDVDAVAKAIDAETAAILVEPIQGEGGVNIPDDGYLPALRELCDDHGILLMVDEVQTGCGRTGKWFGYQHSGIEPDIMTLAKALGGGAPIGPWSPARMSPRP